MRVVGTWVAVWIAFSSLALNGHGHSALTTHNTSELAYYALPKGTCCCPEADELDSISHCHSALHFVASLMGFPEAEAEEYDWEGTNENIPPACSFKVWPSGKTGGGHWNHAKTGAKRDDMIPICHDSSVSASSHTVDATTEISMFVLPSSLPPLYGPSVPASSHKDDATSKASTFGLPFSPPHSVLVNTKYYPLLPKGTCCCPETHEVDSISHCRDALQSLANLLQYEKEADEFGWEGFDESIPPACSFKVWASDKRAVGHWNFAKTGAKRADMVQICRNPSVSDELTDDPTPTALKPLSTNYVSWPKTEYYTLPKGTCCCPEADELDSISHCHEALQFVASFLGFPEQEAAEYGWMGNDENIPPACSFKMWPSGKTGRGHWNRAKMGGNRDDMIPICHDSSVSASRSPTIAMRPLQAYYFLPKGTCCCPEADVIDSISHCHSALRFVASHLGFNEQEAKEYGWGGNDENVPQACSFKVWPGGETGRGHWNLATTGSSRDDMIPVCHRSSVPYDAIVKPPSPAYYTLPKGTCCCPKEDEIDSMSHCNDALQLEAYRMGQGYQEGMEEYSWDGTDESTPPACSMRTWQSGTTRRGHWNRAKKGASRDDMIPICHNSSVSASTEQLFHASFLIHRTPAVRVALSSALGAGSMFVVAISLAVVFRRGVRWNQPSTEDVATLIAVDDESA